MRVVRNMAVAVVSVLLLVTALVGPGGGAAQAAAAQGKLTLVAGQVITATFSGTKLDKNRQVSLDKSTDNGVTWTSIKTAKMSSKGAVNFGVVATDPGQYRAVAKAFTYKVKKKKVTAEAVVSPTREIAEPDFRDEFNEAPLSDVWRSREEVGYQASGRWCSAPLSANTSVSGGAAVLKMTAATDPKAVEAAAKERQKEANLAAVAKADTAVAKAEANLAKAKAMPQKTKSQKSKRNAAIKKAESALKKAKSARAALTPGCPTGAYGNAMITTQGSGQTFQAGTVVAKVKFSEGQGAHAGIWLQAANRQEIDIIEAYGYGRGVTNVIHRLVGSKLVKDPAADKSAYVAASTVKSKSWWSKWHIVSVSFDESAITFHLDGVKTRQLKGMSAADYSLVVSLLSSDWETYRVNKPDVRPGSGVKKSTVKKQKSLPSMSVDWIRVWKKA